MPDRPPIHSRVYALDYQFVKQAIDTAKQAMAFFTVGNPIIHEVLHNYMHLDVPILYMSFVIDAIHYDPVADMPSPKGRALVEYRNIKPEKIKSSVENIIHSATVVEAVEFREPESAWVVPVMWNNMIIMHIKVSYDGKELVPDMHLTEEVMRNKHSL